MGHFSTKRQLSQKLQLGASTSLAGFYCKFVSPQFDDVTFLVLFVLSLRHFTQRDTLLSPRLSLLRTPSTWPPLRVFPSQNLVGILSSWVDNVYMSFCLAILPFTLAHCVLNRFTHSKQTKNMPIIDHPQDCTEQRKRADSLYYIIIIIITSIIIIIIQLKMPACQG